ncbi:MAG: sulfatase [Planctomycetota bacterium]|nr:MAG: sulfatase [Planctomycetota bacterium]
MFNNIKRLFISCIKYYVFGLFILSHLFGGQPLSAKQTANNQKLNFVFILTDDLGWRGLTCYGSTFYETPNIDKLATQGMRFTDNYAAAPLCSATRACLMSGKYPARLHITGAVGHGPPRKKAKKTQTERKGPPWRKLVPADQEDYMALEEITIAEMLKSAGYVTAFIGKWHLGKHPYYPENQGFDINIGGNHQAAAPSHFDPYRLQNLTNRKEGEYLADRLTDEALTFLEQHKDKPFFLYLPHYAVHTPIMAKKELIKKYQAKIKPGQKQKNPTYAGMIQSVDESVGRIMRKLDQLNLADRTVVIFTSDNGGLVHIPRAAGDLVTSNEPLRGWKATLWEGGIRVPLIVRWPGAVKAGSECNVPVVTADFYPTILEIAGIKPNPQQVLDGESILPLLKQSGKLKRRAIYFHFPHYIPGHHQPEGKLRKYWTKPVSVVRQGDYKLLYFDDDRHVELYNLKDDISETNNLADKMPKLAEQLHNRLLDWRKEVNANLCNPNPQYDPDYVYKEPPSKKKKAGKKKQ